MYTKVPPNGGWGWIIALAYALNNLATIPIMQGFGLIFKESFTALNLTAMDTSIIVNMNFSFGMILGLINGPLLKTFGYRKIAMTGSILYSTGVILTAFANSFSLIIISYGMLASIGMGLSLSAFSLAINSYFTTKRGRAMGLMMTVTGLGPIFTPQMASFLLSVYGTQGTILLFGAYTLHSLIGSILLQPVKWHMKSEPICLETIPKNSEISDGNEEDKFVKHKDKANTQSSAPTINGHPRQRKITTSSIDHDNEVGTIYGFDTPLLRQSSVDPKINASNDEYYNDDKSVASRISMTNLHDGSLYSKYPGSRLWWTSNHSVNSINLGSSMKIFDEERPVTKKLTFIDDKDTNNGYRKIANKDPALENGTENGNNCSPEENCHDENNKNESIVYRIARRIAVMYDLDLLCDPVYVNILLGMSIAIFAELNFSLLTPFILAEMKMTTARIATVMSVIATADLISRCAAPFLGEWLRQPPRIMYLLSLCLLIISRSSLIFIHSFVSVLVIAIGLGISKGIRSVYLVLVVPSYVPIHKLPGASGIQMVTNGIVLMAAGPLLGLIRDNSGSYVPFIIVINCVTAITVIIWSTEILIIRRRKSARQRTEFSAGKP